MIFSGLVRSGAPKWLFDIERLMGIFTIKSRQITICHISISLAQSQNKRSPDHDCLRLTLSPSVWNDALYLFLFFFRLPILVPHSHHIWHFDHCFWNENWDKTHIHGEQQSKRHTRKMKNDWNKFEDAILFHTDFPRVTYTAVSHAKSSGYNNFQYIIICMENDRSVCVLKIICKRWHGMEINNRGV